MQTVHRPFSLPLPPEPDLQGKPSLRHRIGKQRQRATTNRQHQPAAPALAAVVAIAATVVTNANTKTMSMARREHTLRDIKMETPAPKDRRLTKSQSRINQTRVVVVVPAEPVLLKTEKGLVLKCRMTSTIASLLHHMSRLDTRRPTSTCPYRLPPPHRRTLRPSSVDHTPPIRQLSRPQRVNISGTWR